ncbi:MAG TPA: PHB depolymerase family esterase, partial [Anaeromyxobacter sp.]|nr:PHB depolymerase family esterase [Anaeromyxobacter sp.]
VQWREPLHRHGMIFVAASRSGNEVPILDRRLPLALLAYENVRRLYPLDPERIYLAGFSGGSRAALVTALAYPDVFRGVVLEAGSDPIGGERGIHLPPADLFRRFEESRLVYVTGEQDRVNLHDDLVSRDSMRQWCVLEVAVLRPRQLGHELMGPAWLDHALEALEGPTAADAGERAACNSRVEQELEGRLAEVEAALGRGDRRGARARLREIDGHFAGLAGPALLDLDARVGAP